MLTQITVNLPKKDMGPVCLIIPPSVFLLDERVTPSGGILSIAAILEQYKVPVEVLDLSGLEHFEKAVVDYVHNSPHIKAFGITTTTAQMPKARDILNAIRSQRPSAKIILGGPHVTSVNAASKGEMKRGVTDGRADHALHQLDDFDVIVAGDGEEAIFHALTDGAPHLIDGDDIKSSLFLKSETLESLPFPARHLIDVHSYMLLVEGEPALSLIAQLGCPFECGFCGMRNSPSFRKIRTRSSGRIVEEIEHIYRTTGRKGFMFQDDELNVNKQVVSLMEHIIALQKKLEVEFRLRGFIKAELFTDEQAEVMYKAGFRWILTGFESAHPEILRSINKKATREENTRCVNIAHNHGLKVKALMSIGHPGESEETVWATRDWLLEVKPADFDVTIITPYPGTPYYDEAVPHPSFRGVWVYTQPKTGAKLFQYDVDYSRVADYYKGDPNDGYHSHVFTEFLSPEELVRLRGEVEREVRTTLEIPFYARAASSLRYETSMGQFGHLPPNIWKKSYPQAPLV